MEVDVSPAKKSIINLAGRNHKYIKSTSIIVNIVLE